MTFPFVRTMTDVEVAWVINNCEVNVNPDLVPGRALPDPTMELIASLYLAIRPDTGTPGLWIELAYGALFRLDLADVRERVHYVLTTGDLSRNSWDAHRRDDGEVYIGHGVIVVPVPQIEVPDDLSGLDQ